MDKMKKIMYNNMVYEFLRDFRRVRTGSIFIGGLVK